MATDGLVAYTGKKAKTAKGLPKRTGRKGAKHGAGSNRIPGKKRNRSKAPGHRGVAVCVSGLWVELGIRKASKAA